MSRGIPRFHVLVLLCVVALGLAGCSAPAEADSDGPTQRLRVSGSGTALPVVRVLTEQYSAENPEIEFVYLPGLHSSGGIKGVASGDLDLGAVSRDLTSDEQDHGLDYTHLSDDGLVIATHPGVAIEGLSTDQVKGIYSGEYDNWSDLGGPNLPMVILDRNEDESAKIILRKHVLGSELEITPQAVSLFYESDMVQAVEDTPGAIGYFSLGYAVSEGLDVNYLALDGAEATVESIGAGEYSAIRPLGVVSSPGAPDEIVDFVEWTQSDEAQALIESQGFAQPRSTTE
jgi:phosphate transport system substrate-binding protein